MLVDKSRALTFFEFAVENLKQTLQNRGRGVNYAAEPTNIRKYLSSVAYLYDMSQRFEPENGDQLDIVKLLKNVQLSEFDVMQGTGSNGETAKYLLESIELTQSREIELGLAAMIADVQRWANNDKIDAHGADWLIKKLSGVNHDGLLEDIQIWRNELSSDSLSAAYSDSSETRRREKAEISKKEEALSYLTSHYDLTLPDNIISHELEKASAERVSNTFDEERERIELYLKRCEALQRLAEKSEGFPRNGLGAYQALMTGSVGFDPNAISAALPETFKLTVDYFTDDQHGIKENVRQTINNAHSNTSGFVAKLLGGELRREQEVAASEDAVEEHNQAPNEAQQFSAPVDITSYPVDSYQQDAPTQDDLDAFFQDVASFEQANEPPADFDWPPEDYESQMDHEPQVSESSEVPEVVISEKDKAILEQMKQNFIRTRGANNYVEAISHKIKQGEHILDAIAGLTKNEYNTQRGGYDYNDQMLYWRVEEMLKFAKGRTKEPASKRVQLMIHYEPTIKLAFVGYSGEKPENLVRLFENLSNESKSFASQVGMARSYGEGGSMSEEEEYLEKSVQYQGIADKAKAALEKAQAYLNKSKEQSREETSEHSF